MQSQPARVDGSIYFSLLLGMVLDFSIKMTILNDEYGDLSPYWIEAYLIDKIYRWVVLFCQIINIVEK